MRSLGIEAVQKFWQDIKICTTTVNKELQGIHT